MTPEMAINITRLSVALSFCWPVPASSSRGRVFFVKIVLVVATISGFVLVLFLMYGAYVHFGDVILTSKCVCLTMCVSQFVMQTVICLVKYETLQVSFCLKIIYSSNMSFQECLILVEIFLEYYNICECYWTLIRLCLCYVMIIVIVLVQFYALRTWRNCYSFLKS